MNASTRGPSRAQLLAEVDARPLREAIGAQVARLREDAGKRQDDLATVARRMGLAWNRAKVADLERGAMAVSAEDLLLLPLVLTLALDRDDRPVTYAELFATDVHVALSRCTWVSTRDLPGLLGDTVHRGQVVRLVVPQHEHAATRRAFRNRGEDQRSASLRVGNVASELVAATAAGETEAEQRIARRLGEPREVLTRVYARLWGRSLSAERDARVADALPPGTDPRTVQAKRGRITRDLMSEVEEFIRNEERKPSGKRRSKD